MIGASQLTIRFRVPVLQTQVIEPLDDIIEYRREKNAEQCYTQHAGEDGATIFRQAYNLAWRPSCSSYLGWLIADFVDIPPSKLR